MELEKLAKLEKLVKPWPDWLEEELLWPEEIPLLKEEPVLLLLKNQEDTLEL